MSLTTNFQRYELKLFSQPTASMVRILFANPRRRNFCFGFSRMLFPLRVVSSMRTVFHQHQVFYPVVIFFAVFMVDNFVSAKSTAYMLFHNDTMFCDISLCSTMWVFFIKEIYVPTPQNISSASAYSRAVIATIKARALGMLRHKWFAADLAIPYFRPVGFNFNVVGTALTTTISFILGIIRFKKFTTIRAGFV